MASRVVVKVGERVESLRLKETFASYGLYTLGSTNIAGWKWTRNEDVFPIENGDIPLLC